MTPLGKNLRNSGLDWLGDAEMDERLYALRFRDDDFLFLQIGSEDLRYGLLTAHPQTPENGTP